jgi:hypothetical protein
MVNSYIKNPQTGGVKKSSSGKPVRSFKLLTINNRKARKDTRSVSATPGQSASKLFSRYCSRLKKGAKCATTLKIQETTRGSDHKVYRYNALRARNNDSINVKGKTIKFKFKNIISSRNLKNKTMKK